MFGFRRNGKRFYQPTFHKEKPMINTAKRSTLLLACLVIVSTALAACGPAGGGSKATDVQVTLSDFTIDSSLTTFSVGVPYHFIIVNKGSVAHEFYIMPPADPSTADSKKSQAVVAVTQNDLAAGATKTVDYTFTAAAPEGTLEMSCHISGHYEAGMHVPIVVK
jgi:uncharacterized cupredoxin-like copper-binding protein